jgi:RNA polymerase sigma-70 factor (ECF subfamily)
MARSDKDIIKECKNGDTEAFKILINRYKKDAVNIAYQMVNDSQLAEDIAQESFIKVYKYIDNFREDSKFFTWLYKIILNLCRDHFRKLPDENILSLEGVAFKGLLRKEVPDSFENPERYLKNQELQREIKESLNTLSFKHRQVVVLKDLQGFTYKEIADILDIPLGTVKSRLNTARRRLQKKLAQIKEENI